MQNTECHDCSRPLTDEEIAYYEIQCEDCAAAWTSRMRNWSLGITHEPELDSMFGKRSADE